MKKTILFFLILAIHVTSFADVKLSNIFSDNMVLQRHSNVKIFGTADKGEKITVHFNGQKISVTADENGNWKATLQPMKAGGPFQMTVKGKNEIVLQNVLIGEVWIASGQSNMDYDLRGIEEFETIEKANNPNIRQIFIPRVTSFKPNQDIDQTEWVTFNPKTAGNFSAVGYYFAKKLYEKLNVPVGIIKTAWGGTNIETWMSYDGIQENPYFAQMMDNTAHSVRAIVQRQIDAKLDKVRKFQNGNIDASDAKNWKEENYDDSLWQKIYAPMFWEEQGLADFDGIGWYRKEFYLTKEQAENAVKVHLAKIDDFDETYLNGTLLGRVWDYRLPREYNIPANLMKEGRNQLAVRDEDTGGGGGIYGEKDEMFIEFKNYLPSFPLSGEWKLRIDTNGISKAIYHPNSYPSLLYNAMINPLLDYSFQGFIWYQGEANAWRAKQYGSLFPLFIKDLRQKFNKPEMPFYYVQLASYNANDSNSVNGSAWAELRNVQRETLSIPFTGMAVTSDIGDAKDIHPRNKKDVGNRLAFWALNKTYKKSNLPSGPLYRTVEFKNGKAYVGFNYIGSGLKIRKGEENLSGFIIAGFDKKFYLADAKIIGNQVVVSSKHVKDPAAVRYAWTDVIDDANLYNKEGLPASPFKTDNWAGITDNNKYLFAK